MEPNPLSFTSDQWRNTHHTSVMSILGAETPQVISKGSRFYNIDRWTLRHLVSHMCDWAKENPGVVPTQSTIADWVNLTNQVMTPNRQIVIASAPSELTLRTALALVGGAYHEALHTKYSCRRDLTCDEVWGLIEPRWGLIDNWAAAYHLIQEWGNIIEDIRIERCGNEAYPGCFGKLCELQDFIIGQESGNTDMSTLHVVTAMFRDLGLDYPTEAQQQAFDRYREANPKACAFVEEGPLKPILDQAIQLSPEDATGCLRLALDALVILSQITKLQQEKPKPDQDIKTPPVDDSADSEANSVDGNADLKSNTKPNKDVGSPKIEMPAGISNEEEHDYKTWEIQDGSEDTGTPSKEEAETDPSNNKEPKTEPSDNKQPNQGAGGYKWDPDPVTPWEIVAEELLHAAETGQGTGLKDVSSALAEVFENIREHEDSTSADDEMQWRPWSTNKDVVLIVEPSKAGRAADETRARILFDSIRKESLYLRTRLRVIMKSITQRAIVHGVPKGRDLSERTLVESVVSLQAGKRPDRAYYVMGDKIDVSLAACIVIDESESMSWNVPGSLPPVSKLQEATKCLMAIADPLDNIGAAVMVVGFRDGPSTGYKDPKDRSEYHRTTGICYDIFKKFDERLSATKWRFANTRGVGGTPMSDGIQFGLNALKSRNETHKILFVITDGQPNTPHDKVMRKQIRLAKKEGLYIIGVGIGPDSAYVETVFPDSVWASCIQDMPKLLVEKLNRVVDFRNNTRKPKR